MRFVLPIGLVLAGCAKVPNAAADGQALAASLGPASGPAQNCIRVPAGEGLTVLADGVVGYRSGRTTWVNHMPEQCRLRPFSTLMVERHGAQVCHGDRVRTLEVGASIPGPACILGRFVPHASM